VLALACGGATSIDAGPATAADSGPATTVDPVPAPPPDPRPAIPLDYGPCVPANVAHVEVFGYYAGIGYLNELAPTSNMTWGPPSAAAAADAAGVRAVIDVQGVFQIASLVAPAPDVVAAAWAKATSAIGAHLASVAALYVSDEPYWNAYRNGTPFADVSARLAAAAQTIRATPGFEHVPLALVFADPELDWFASDAARFPAEYDWVGWDLYNATLERLAERTALFLSLVQPGQRVIAVPDAFLWQSVDDARLQQLSDRIAFWLAWIERTPEVVAVAPFIYQDGGDGGVPWIGARNLPSIRDRYAQIGSCIRDAAAGQP
jgi:hypothetical protein